MSERQPTAIRTPEQYLELIGDDQGACMSFGHNWASRGLRPNEPLPAGMWTEPQDDGYFYLWDTCLGCGKRRRQTMLPDRTVDETAKLGYRDTKDWMRIPRAAGVTRSMIRFSHYNKCLSVIFANGRKRGRTS
jgi:hypothetical protein